MIPLSVIADETEIFYASEKAKVNTNILFLLDASGSMLKEVPGSGGKNRMQVMQDTFRQVMEVVPEHLNIGLMNYANADFLGSHQWDSVKGVGFPISPIDLDATSVVGSYSAVDNLPDPITGTPVRDFLADVVDSWEAKGYTPIVDSLYEAARYFRGESSVWGKYPAAYKWAAHPSSYTGTLACDNPVVQECRLEWGECNGTQQNCSIKGVSSCCNWIEDAAGGYCENNDYSCSTDITHCEQTTCDSISGDMAYKSPMQYSCQPNFLVLMSDGKPEYPYFSNRTVDGTGRYPKSAYPNYAHDSFLVPGLTPTVSSIEIPDPIPALISSNCADKPSGFASGTCGPELTNFLATEDQNPTLPGDQTIETYTVAFGMADEPKGTAYLASLATAKNGAYKADNATELAQVLKDVFNDIDKKSYSFSSPSFSISDESLLSNGSDIYVPVFSNSTNPLWSGNLRKLRVSLDNRITGAGGSAVLTDSGEFMDTAQDLWSTQPHGSDAAVGGAASKLPPPDSRWRRTDVDGNTLVDLSSATSETLITPLMLSRGIRRTRYDLPDTHNNQTGKKGADGFANKGWYIDCDGNLVNVDRPLQDAVNIEEVTTCPVDPIDSAKRNTILDFTRGYALTDTGEIDPSIERKHIGDILNSKPIVVKYETKTLVLVATNEGYLHAFNAETGVEEWAFMPSIFLKNQLTFMENKEEEPHVYGLDGSLTLWNHDADKDGVISRSSDAKDKRMLFFGLRRGGNMYYALDITSLGPPKVVWKISPTLMSGALTTGFTNLGETWSKPALSKMRIATAGGTDSEVKYVLVFGGGYDPKYDEYDRASRPNTDALGSDVYIVDAENGDLLWSAKNDANKQAARKLQHSVASDIRVLDMDNNGELDRLYFADLGGNVWRVDLGIDITSSNGNTSFSNKTTLTKLAELGNDNDNDGRFVDGDHRKFFYEPDTALRMHGSEVIMTVSLGSGYRTHPLDQGDKDNFYVLLDRDVYQERNQSPNAVIKHTDLKVANPDGTGFSGSILDYPNSGGWYMPLTHNGEKVLAGSVTFLDKVLFTTFAQADVNGAPNVVGPCSPLETSSRAYTLNILTGQSVANLKRTTETDAAGNPVDTRTPFIVAGGTGEILDTPQLIFSKLTDGSGGDCREGNCQQSVSVRVGKLDLPLLDLENTKNRNGSEYSEMVDLTKLLPRLYWRDNEVSNTTQ